MGVVWTWHGRPQKFFQVGATSTFRLSFFRWRTIECKWTFTKRFTLSAPQRKFPVKTCAPFAFFEIVFRWSCIRVCEKVVHSVILYSFFWIGVSSNIIIIVNCRQLTLNWTWTIHNCVCGAHISLCGLNLPSQN